MKSFTLFTCMVLISLIVAQHYPYPQWHGDVSEEKVGVHDRLGRKCVRSEYTKLQISGEIFQSY